MNRELYINITNNEVCIALLENGRLVEFRKEKRQQQFIVGDVYWATVKKIMPGLNAAFINVGSSKDAFLHYHDLGPQFKSLCRYAELTLQKRERIAFSKLKTLPDIRKEGKIADVLKPGQHIPVQVVKEPISTKGARLSSEISIAGRNIVLLPFGNSVSISQKIEDEDERKRLKDIINALKPSNYSVILRTVSEGKKAVELDTEMRSLIKKWEEAFEKNRGAAAPKLILGELDSASSIIRDILNESFNTILIDDEKFYEEIKIYIKKIAPEKLNIVKLFQKPLPIFEHFGINKQIKSLFGKTISFRNGAYLVIEHTEALHVIDVNSGNRSRLAADQASTALDVNLASIDEIARQLRLRDMGGIIVIDFIDMQNNEHRQKVYDKMKEAMEKDRTKHNILPLSKFGLMQITRQRVRQEMNIDTSEECPGCGGTKRSGATLLIIDEMENNIRLVKEKFGLKKIKVITHPFIESHINRGFFCSIRKKWQKKLKCRISVKPLHSLNLFDYKLFTVDNEEIDPVF